MNAVPQVMNAAMSPNFEGSQRNHTMNMNEHQMNDLACANNYQLNDNHSYKEYNNHIHNINHNINQSYNMPLVNNMRNLNINSMQNDINNENLDNGLSISTNRANELSDIYGSSLNNPKLPNYGQNMGQNNIGYQSGGSSNNYAMSCANNNVGNNTTSDLSHDIKDNSSNYYADDRILPSSRVDNCVQRNVDDPDGALGPLPPKWETAYTERGELYFIDHNTGTSHWLDPRLSKFQKKSLEDCSEDELPYGWEKIEDSLYGTYFIDHVNRKTQYENPVLEAKRRAAEHKQRINDMQQRSQTPLSSINKYISNEGTTSSTASTVDIAQRNNMAHLDKVNTVPLNLNGQSNLPFKFTKNPNELVGNRIVVSLVKSVRGFGLTIVGGDSADGAEEFLQIKSIVPNSPAWMNSRLQTGDILIYVNNTCVLGYSHNEMVKMFQSILPGEVVSFQVCRGYPLPFDPNDPNTEVVTTNAVDSSDADRLKPLNKYSFMNSLKEMPVLDNSGFILMKKSEVYTFSLKKGAMGFGFTVTDSAQGQKVKKILDSNCCAELLEGDILLEINNIDVRHKSHNEVVQILKECSKTESTTLKISRVSSSDLPENSNNLYGFELSNLSKLKKNYGTNFGIYRSKTPTADLYSTQQKEMLPIRPKTPLVDTRRMVHLSNKELSEDAEVEATISSGNSHSNCNFNDQKLSSSGHEMNMIKSDVPYMESYPKMVSGLSERLADVSLGSANTNNKNFNNNFRLDELNCYSSANVSLRKESQNLLMPTASSAGSIYNGHHESCFCFSCQENSSNKFNNQQSFQKSIYGQNIEVNRMPANMQYLEGSMLLLEEQRKNESMHRRVNDLLNVKGRFGEYSVDYETQNTQSVYQDMPQQISPSLSSVSQQPDKCWNPALNNGIYATHPGVLDVSDDAQQFELSEVTLERQALGFGFRIVGGTEEGSQVTIGHIVPGGAADNNHRINSGDEILSIDGIKVVNASHHKVVELMGEAAARGQVTMILRRRLMPLNNLPPISQVYPPHSSAGIHYPYDVSVSRSENESFGFVIISSSNQYYGSTIGKLIAGSPADRCGDLNVGDRIIAVNGVEITGMTHGDVVNLIKESGLQVQLTIGCPMKEVSSTNSMSSSSGLAQLPTLDNSSIYQRSNLTSPSIHQ